MARFKASPTIGLIVNPIAGLGGPVGLHGTDGIATWQRAEKMGGIRRAAALTEQFLFALGECARSAKWLAGPAGMGEDCLAAAAIPCRVLSTTASPAGERPNGSMGPRVWTTSADTTSVAACMSIDAVDLIIFAGGDGTARDVISEVDDETPVIGIPAGVKMQSGVFGRSAGATARAVRDWMERGQTTSAEIVDLDETARQRGVVDSRIYGTALTISTPDGVVSGRKMGSTSPSHTSHVGIAAEAYDRLDPSAVWLLGPGRTVQVIGESWGLNPSLLGVDIVDGGRIVEVDAAAEAIARYTRNRMTQVLLSPIGGQGFLLGRGNQQVIHGLDSRLSLENIVVVATPEKLASIAGGPLYVDLGSAVSCKGKEFVRVITGRSESAIVEVAFV